MSDPTEGHVLRVRGTVQGVGFRPHVANLARSLGLSGWVRNDGDGVTIALLADERAATRFRDALLGSLPPLARVDAVEVVMGAMEGARLGAFIIAPSAYGAPDTEVAPDAAACAACARETATPGERRHRYPFTNCTHCGPRYSIIVGIPYDRARTTMAGFPPCAACRAELEDERDRRYHAQPIACPACGPRAWLERAAGGGPPEPDASADAVAAATSLLLGGAIVAVKGLGGYHLMCDATNDEVVRRLRARKRRDDKPLALLVRDVEVARRWAETTPAIEEALASREAPIVLVPRRTNATPPLSDAVAPGLSEIGVMVAATPLQTLLLERVDRPMVCTSGNASDEPTAFEDDDARARLGAVADWLLVHDRPIARRLDDSVVRPMAGAIRVLRRARGYAPAKLAAPPGFERAPAILAMGGDLKSTVCILQRGRAIPSEHFGDLDDARAWIARERGVDALRRLFAHEPAIVAVDAHPAYRASDAGRALARERGIPCEEVLHHHAHVAACLFENGHPLDGAPVVGVALDGIGWGAEGALWGGEVLVGSYRAFERVGSLAPVALPGGDAAAREPWRSLYAHLVATAPWAELRARYGGVATIARLAERPLATLDALVAAKVHAPRASSTGRLFDAVAAALGVRFDRVSFEGQAAMELEALATPDALAGARATPPYPVVIAPADGIARFDPAATWRAILGDLQDGAAPGLIAARFHLALAEVVRALVAHARAGRPGIRVVALSGGVFQNRVLLEAAIAALQADGADVWTHSRLPPGDGCISLGQAAVAAARACPPLTGEASP